MRFEFFSLAVPGLFCALAWPAAAVAHIAPAVDVNNRYVWLTPMGDRVRLAYTVYIGELPGARARERIDVDGDGRLSDREIRAYRDELAANVAVHLDIAMDGQPRTISWSKVHVGMGTRSVNAGAFSVDLIGWICAPDPGDERKHRLVLHDRYQLPQPGETELRVKASPGISITRSTLDEDGRVSQLEFTWMGQESPLAGPGYYLEFGVDPEKAALLPDAPCRTDQMADPPPAHRPDRDEVSRLAVTALAIALGVVAIAGMIAWRVSRRRRQPTQLRL